MKINEAFPSNFLKADDLQGQSVTVTIKSVDMEELGQGRDAEDKLCITFQGKDKKLICNKTNAKTIAKHYGDDTDDWIGQRITIQPREVEFQGDMVWAIRVSLTKPAPMNSAAPRPAPAEAPAPAPRQEQPRAAEEPHQPSDNDGGEDSVPF